MIELISEVRSINSGNRVLERLQRCIHLADLLDEWDAGKPRRSFIAWLRAMAVGEEEGK